MDIRELEWFTALAENENVTVTAAQLHVSQPTLSRALARLERKVGVSLFDRHQNHLRLNKYGAIFQSHALRAISELNTASTRIDALVDPQRGVVTLGFMHDFGGWLVPDMLCRFREEAPLVTFELREGSADTIVDDVRNGHTDCGLVGPAPVGDDLEWLQLGSEELRVAVAPSHPFAKREKVSLAEVADEPLVALRAGTGLRMESDRAFASAGATPTIVIETSLLSTLVALVEIGMGVALVPQSPRARRAPRSVVSVALEGQTHRTSYGTIGRLGGPGGLAARRFRRFVRTQIDASDEWLPLTP